MRHAFCKLAILVAIAAALGGTALRAQQSKNSQEDIIHPKTHPVKFDARLGASTAVLSESKGLKQMSVTLVELPPGKQVAPRRELAEEMIYIVSGKGYSEIWNGKDGKKIRYDWKAGDLLSPSLNSFRQH